MLNTRSNLALACTLSGLAGYVDGIGFIHLGGLFVSFMSGNSTRLGVMVAEMDWRKAVDALALIALFVAGAGAGSLIGRGRGRHRQWLLLLVEALLLAGAAAAAAYGRPQWAIAIIVLAMGLENAVFQVDGGAAGLGLTYMTGTLVRVGQLLAAALMGGPRWAWLPNLLLWAALVIGAALGAMAYQRLNLAAVWFGAATALLASAVVGFAARSQPSDH
ncbi:MAG: YoaK family protein [Tardiphaga sp.]